MKTNVSKKTIIMAILSLVFITSCGQKKNSDNQSTATADNPNQSSIEDVRTAILEAYESLVLEDPIYENALYKILRSAVEQEQMDVVNIALEVIAPPEEKLKHLPISTEDSLFLTITDYLKLSKLVLKTIEPCLNSFGETKEVTLSKNMYGADICFNLESLRRIPKDSLKSEIMGIFLYQIVLMNGFEEADAALLQNFYLNKPILKNNLSTTPVSGDQLKYSGAATILEISSAAFNSCQAFKVKDYNSTYFLIGLGAAKLDMIENVFGNLKTIDKAIVLEKPGLHSQFRDDLAAANQALSDVISTLQIYQKLESPLELNMSEVVNTYNKYLDSIYRLVASFDELAYGVPHTEIFYKFDCNN